MDTNILVRALIKPLGAVGPVLHRLRDGDYQLITSQPLLDELVDVLNRPRIRTKYGLSDADIAAALKLILLQGDIVAPERQITACRDPKDDKFLEAALAGRADVIVSGDDDLLVLSPFESIPIMSPARFLAVLASE